ncbi:MAG: hypothetical protein ACOH14_01270 [Rhodoglobus sp.]
MSSDRLLPALSPGINVLTIHPRYWSFYAWVLDDYWLADLPRNRASFRDFYRPREALFSMACHVCEAPEHSSLVANIVGSRRVSPLASEPSFDPQFDYIKEPLGGYGLYYRSAMEATGALIIATPANGFPWDAPTAAGKAIASSYRDAVKTTHLVSRSLAGDLTAQVDRDTLVQFAGKGCLCQLRGSSAPDLPLLQDLFTHSGVGDEPMARRATLRLIIDLSQVQQTEAISEDIFRQLVYFRQIQGETFQPQPDLLEIARKWRLYQAREYFSFALNRLFAWVVRTGQDESDDGLVAIPLDRLWERIDEALDGQEFSTDRNLGGAAVNGATRASSFADLLAMEVGAEAGVNSWWPRHETLDEHSLFERCNNTTDDGETLVAILAIVLLVYRRLGTPTRVADLLTDQQFLAEGGSVRVGMAKFFAQLGRKLTTGISVSDLAQWLISDFVIVQHERVATAKLPDDTFRVRRVGDHLRFFMQEAPADFNNSRFNALSTTAHELGLVSTLRQPHRSLTKTGEQLLRVGDIPTGALTDAALRFEPAEDSL